MEELLKYAGATGLNALLAFTLGWLLTEFRRPLFNFKPFNCRPCLTFWLSFVLSVVVYRFVLGLVWHGTLVLAAILSFVLFIHLKTKSKIYE